MEGPDTMPRTTDGPLPHIEPPPPLDGMDCALPPRDRRRIAHMNAAIERARVQFERAELTRARVAFIRDSLAGAGQEIAAVVRSAVKSKPAVWVGTAIATGIVAGFFGAHYLHRDGGD